MKLELAGRVLPKSGERECGDCWWSAEVAGSSVIAVLDALGHGPIAAEVARRGKQALELCKTDEPVAIINELHRALAGTRGASAMVCTLGATRLRGCGVGNVTLRSLGTRVPAVWTPGVIGVQMRTLRQFEAELTERTRLAMFSDGISSRLELPGPRIPCEEACEIVMNGWRNSFDDATIVIADVDPRAS